MDGTETLVETMCFSLEIIIPSPSRIWLLLIFLASPSLVVVVAVVALPPPLSAAAVSVFGCGGGD